MALEYKEIKPNPDGESRPRNYITELKDFLDLRYEVRRNALTLELEIRDLEELTFSILDETKLNSIWIEAVVGGHKCTTKVILAILNSDYTETYNPIQSYFEALPEYDGIYDYIAELANTVTISDISVDDINLKALWLPYLKKWLVANVAMAMGIGINQTCLILVGGQGSGKTTWLNKLCPPAMKKFLVCSHINPSLTDQNTANYLAEKWLVNVDDQLETIFGKDFNSMKAIITAPFVTNRKAYHRLTKTRPRVCSFMGSVNNPRFLTDSENRRYLVFSTQYINYNHNIDMDKVWAQALHLAKTQYPYWFNHEDIKKLNKVNEIYKQNTPEEEWLQRLFEPCEPTNPKASFLMSSEILTKLNAWSGMRLSIKKLSIAMDKLKYGQPISKRIDGRSPRKVYALIEHTM